MFINNQFVESSAKGTRDLCSPMTEAVFATVSESSEADVEAAVQSAKHALPAWISWPGMERRNLLLKLADKVEANIEELR